ncbi:MAG TPA: LssY C-terminal domain-containing protein [Terriglobales bacterium]|nr:LssY C-terminal domain-containing protein [Terriglobales bacterium]
MNSATWIISRAAVLVLAGVMAEVAPCAQEQPAEPSREAPSPGAIPQVSQSKAEAYQIEVAGSQQWVDTKIDLHAGEKLHITADGIVTYPNGKSFGPAGLPRGVKDVIHEYAVLDAGHGALIGRLGSGDAAHSFLVGGDSQYQAPVAGRLFLGINQSHKDAEGAQGQFQVRVVVVDPGLNTAAGTNAGGPPDSNLSYITTQLLAKLPRRVTDEKGGEGDMVNALLVGTEADVVSAFIAAEWVKVDKSVKGSIMAALKDTMEKEDYLTMPMSILYLFGRAQDYGFAHAEPVRVVMSRNHLRVWKSPYQVDGKPLWCVAATHDIGFERDQRNNGITHKIDPAIDGEREYVNDTLSGTGLVVARNHVTPPNALTEAKTATGGGFHSDGRILVLVLKSPPGSASATTK